MKSSAFRSHHAPTANDLEPYRTKLSRALGQAQLGGVSRALLVAERLTADDCTAAIKLGWQMKDSKAKMWPCNKDVRLEITIGRTQPGAACV
jgi:hypothetical protein